MTGQQLLDLLTSILGNEAPSQTYMLQLINIAKSIIETKRPWKVLSTNNHSLVVTGANTSTNPFPLPDDFQRWLGDSSLTEGQLKLFDGNNNIQYLTQVPIEEILDYKNEFGRFAVDYEQNVFYITGVVPGTFTIYEYYIKNTPDITRATKWGRFPANLTTILAFDAACRWRLGTDYDDVAARNAEDNGKMVAMLMEALSAWDTELAIAAVNSIEYRGDQYNNNNTNYPGPRGARANY